ncbi:MAG: transcription antitermination factor NusB [Candidatus Omnitrophica bacterium]|nr:transcription antitermination factor NusB [Candidatus Omnitrophota bacterium]
MRKRSVARECALKILYQKDATARSVDATIEDFWSSDLVSDEDDPFEIDSEIKEFATRLVYGVSLEIESIDAKISSYATNWQLKRMAIIDRNILRMSCFEFFYCPDIPPKVSINEAVELAKKYGDLESSKFVNGILDKIHKTEVISLRQKL